MSMNELSEQVEKLLMVVYELQKMVDAMTDVPPSLIEAMRKVKESAKALDESLPEM